MDLWLCTRAIRASTVSISSVRHIYKLTFRVLFIYILENRMSGNILKDIEDAYSGILNKPFTGNYVGYHTFEDTTGNSRMVIQYDGGTAFSICASKIAWRVAFLEEQYGTKIWKGIINGKIYIAQESALTEYEVVNSNHFVIYRVEAIPIKPFLQEKWPFICNLYVRAL